MQITIFGATSTTGRLTVGRALTAGHQVTAFTRDAARVTAQHNHLRIVEGDVTDPASCGRALDGTALDGTAAVIITLGNGRHGLIREAGTRAVVQAMQDAGVHRLICQSTLGVGASRDNLNLVWRHLMFGALLRGAYADHIRQEEVVTSSGLDWTIAAECLHPRGCSRCATRLRRRGTGAASQGLPRAGG